MIASLGRSAGQQTIAVENPTPEDSLFRKRRLEYSAWDLAFSYRPVLSRRAELGLSLSPLAIDLKVVVIDAPLTVSVLPRWTLLNVSEGMNLEMPLMAGWRSSRFGIFGGAGPRWMVPSNLIMPSYGDTYRRHSSELEGRVASGVQFFTSSRKGLLLEATYLKTIKGDTGRETVAFNLGFFGDL